ncbi:MAG: site-specific recombinase [Ruminococcus flavefaciens]|nr:site-specific recombinase [Ruminococcus flavefaciens]
MHRLQSDKSEYLAQLQSNIERVLRTGGDDEAEKIDIRLNELQKELIDRAGRHEDYSDIAREILSLREKRGQNAMSGSAKSAYLERIAELQDFIQTQPDSITEFDETLVKHLLAKVTVFREKLAFEFKSGVCVDVEM